MLEDGYNFSDFIYLRLNWNRVAHFFLIKKKSALRIFLQRNERHYSIFLCAFLVSALLQYCKLCGFLMNLPGCVSGTLTYHDMKFVLSRFCVCFAEKHVPMFRILLGMYALKFLDLSFNIYRKQFSYDMIED